MKSINLLSALTIVCVMSLSAMAADTTVTLSEVHMCCGNCVTGVATALKPVTGVTAAVASQEKKTIVVTAADKETVQKAVNTLVAAGYFGKSSDSAIKVEAPSGAKDGKVQTLTVEGVHLCCNSCVTAVKEVLTKVDGVTPAASTVVAKAPTITVTGNFEPKALFERLNSAGLAGKIAAPVAAPKP